MSGAARHALLALALITLAHAGRARADGGRVRLHQDAGPFALTLFSAPEPLHVGNADLSVMVQDRMTGEVLLDPEVDVTLRRSDQPAQGAIAAHLSAASASNKLLQAATVRLPRAGEYRLVVSVRRGRVSALCATDIKVEEDRSRTLVIWQYLLLPLAAGVVFAAHQVLASRQRQRRREHGDALRHAAPTTFTRQYARLDRT